MRSAPMSMRMTSRKVRRVASSSTREWGLESCLGGEEILVPGSEGETTGAAALERRLGADIVACGC